MTKAPTKKRKRPFGIYAIIVLLVFLVVNNGLDVLRSIDGMPPHSFPDIGTLAIVVWNAIIFVFCLVLAIGLYRTYSWAWYGAMIASGLSLFFMIWRYFNGGTPYVDMLLLVAIVFYLNQREVKSLFADKTIAGANP